jgi:hypothetical protein
MIKRVFLSWYTFINVIFFARDFTIETIISKIKKLYIKYIVYFAVFFKTWVPLNYKRKEKGKRGRKKEKNILKTGTEEIPREEMDISKVKSTSEVSGKRSTRIRKEPKRFGDVVKY